MANATSEETTQLIEDLKAPPASEAAKHLGEIDAAPAYVALAALNPAFAPATTVGEAIETLRT